MEARDYHDAIWAALPAELDPPGLGARRRFLLEHVAAGDRVLDVGCGDGALTAALGRAGAHAIGVDVAPEALRRAALRDPTLELRLVEAGGPLPLGDGEADVVWGGEVVAQVLDTSGWLSEVRRVLRPGGLLLLSTPAHGRLAIGLLALSGRALERRFDPRCEHLRFYSAGSLRTLLEDFRFEQIVIAGAGGVPGLRRTLLARARRARW